MNHYIVTYHGLLTAAAPIHQGGKSYGNYAALHRERMVTDGRARTRSVPVISGAGMRGKLRRIAADITLDHLAPDGVVPIDVAFFANGGTIRGLRDKEFPNTHAQQALARNIPMFNVFGCAAKNRLVSGHLEVAKAIPVAVQTKNPGLWGAYGVTDEVIAGTTGMDPNNLPRLDDLIEEVQSRNHKPERDPYEKGRRAAYWQVEQFIPGTVFMHRIHLTRATPVDIALVEEVLRVFTNPDRGRIGGKISRGYGAIYGQYTPIYQTPAGHPTDPPAVVDWRDHTTPEDLALLADIL